LNGISGNKVDEEKDEAHYQPDDWEGVEDALGYSSQLSVLSLWPFVATPVHGKNALTRLERD